MPTIFSKIIDGEIPCYRVAENDDFLAFLDISPNSIGHTLCIPKVEVDDILDLDEQTYKNLMLFSRKVAKSIKKVIKTIGRSSRQQGASKESRSKLRTEHQNSGKLKWAQTRLG